MSYLIVIIESLMLQLGVILIIFMMLNLYFNSLSDSCCTLNETAQTIV